MQSPSPSPSTTSDYFYPPGSFARLVSPDSSKSKIVYIESITVEPKVVKYTVGYLDKDTYVTTTVPSHFIDRYNSDLKVTIGFYA